MLIIAIPERMETISIQQFAGLQNATFELRPVTIFIGPQATGKSVTAKLLYFFRGLSGAMVDAKLDGLEWPQFAAQARDRFKKFFPVRTWSAADFEIVYTRYDMTVTVRGTRNAATDDSNEPRLGLIFADDYPAIFASLDSPDARSGGADSEGTESAGRDLPLWRTRLENILRKRLSRHAIYRQIFVTAGRAFFSQVVASVFTQLREGSTLDPFVVEFGALLEQTRSVLANRGFYGDRPTRRLPPPFIRTGIHQMHDVIGTILRGRLVKTPDGEVIVTPDGRIIPAAMGSSGQQEALPLLLLLSRFFLLNHTSGRSIYVEEPEAHLFPTAQRALVELIVETFNRRDKQMEIVLTTHSPYVLTSLNNLLKAGQRYAGADVELKAKLARIIPENRALGVEDFAAYALDAGEARDIVDREAGLVDAATIDTVSEILAEEYQQILWEGR